MSNSLVNVSVASAKDSMVSVFSNAEFGSVRIVEKDGKILFCGKDVAKALGYKDTVNALKLHCKSDEVVNRHPITDSLGRTQQARFITEGDLYRLIVSSKLESAQKFESWVFDEVLPSIRKTGSYQIPVQTITTVSDKELSIREHEINTKRAELLKSLADDYKGKSETFKSVCYVEAVNIVSERKLLNGIESDSNGNLLSATEIANKCSSILGKKVSSQKIGSIAIANNLKTAEFGQWLRTKSQYSNKEVDSFCYKPESVNKFVELLK